MIRKLLSLFICVMMLFCLSTPTFAASSPLEPDVSRTVDDILAEYHEKAFTAENNQTDTPNGNNRKSVQNTSNLEEETVTALTEAGYEAYYVTSANYEKLQEDLQTDLSTLGLDVNGSYIIVISGEQDDTSGTSGNARLGSLPEYDIIDDGGNSFTYYYEPYDRTFTMRYVTIALTAQSSSVNLVSSFGTSYVNSLANSNITALVASNSLYTTSKTLGVLRTLWGCNTSTTYSASTLSLTCSVNWTRKYIQVYDDTVSAWQTSTYSEYASTKTTFTGQYQVGNTSSYKNISYTGSATIYSPNYNNPNEMKIKAVMCFTGVNVTYDRTQEIQIKAQTTSGSVKVLLTVREDF